MSRGAVTGALTALLAALLFPGAAASQDARATVIVEVRNADAPLPGATVSAAGAVHTTGPDGRATLQVAPGVVEIAAASPPLLPATATVTVAAGERREVEITLVDAPEIEEEITVGATRTDRRLDDQPMRVEVLEREEIEEKMLMTPGDVVMMLNEMGGMRVQATAPSLGAASVRIQGMRGRYTRFLSDGLPLFGDQPGALGLLQIAPMDLAQVEVIKGVASSLYGAGAMGGVVNLVSRRPGPETAGEVLVNRSSRGATDTVLFGSVPLSPQWGLTTLAGGHWQERTDVNDDGWADLPGYARGVLRPRLYWDGGGGRTFFATAGITVEDRTGGTLPGRSPAPGSGAFVEEVDTRRYDAAAAGQTLLGGRFVLMVRSGVSRQRHRHQFGDVTERDRHTLAFGEAAVRGAAGRHTWVAGVAIEHDAYAPVDVPRFAHSFTVPGVFVQDDVDVTEWLAVSASARLDRHNRYGAFFSPRLSALLRGGPWAGRVSAGTGFFAPSALSEETEAAGLSRLAIPAGLRAERGRSVSIDVTRTAGPAAVTLTLFGSRVAHPVDVDRRAGLLMTNAAEPATNVGVEFLTTVRAAPFALTGTYTFVRSREGDGTERGVTPLTPAHSAGLVAMWEREDAGRVGVELYYTGAQRLDENPFRTSSAPYVIVGALAERRFGRLRLFVNGENLSGVRQTRWDPLVLPSRAPDGRWTVDAWAPLDGRTINGGVRVFF